MKSARIYNFFLAHRCSGWRLWLVWIICISSVQLLGILRAVTDAELYVASLVLFPVLVMAWIGGLRSGLLMSFIGAAMWLVSDITSARQFSTWWFLWANSATHLLTYSLVAALTAKVRRQLASEHRRANCDALTGLNNRYAFLDAGAAEVARSQRYNHPLAVAFLDLDNFKQLNDSKGHEAGDEALIACANALLGVLRSSDQVARLGGDEFAILLPEVKYDESEAAGNKIIVAVNNALRRFPPVTCSIGMAWFEYAERDFPAMLKAADALMYEAKESGKNAVRSRRFNTTSP